MTTDYKPITLEPTKFVSNPLFRTPATPEQISDEMKGLTPFQALKASKPIEAPMPNLDPASITPEEKRKMKAAKDAGFQLRDVANKILSEREKNKPMTAEEFTAQQKNPITDTAKNIFNMGKSALTNTIQGAGGIIEKGAKAVAPYVAENKTLQDWGQGIKAKYGTQNAGDTFDTNIQQDALNLADGATTLFGMTAAPVASSAFAALPNIPVVGEYASKKLTDGTGFIGRNINKLPGLSNVRDGLPEQDQQRMDNLVGGSAGAMVLGAKGKSNIYKNPKQFLKDNATPASVMRNIEENVLNIPSSIKRSSAPIYKAGGAIFDKAKSALQKPVETNNTNSSFFKVVKNYAAERLINSQIKFTKSNKDIVRNASGLEPTQFMLENDLGGNNIDDMVTNTQKFVDNSMFTKLQTLEGIKKPQPITSREQLIGKSIISQAKNDIQELYGKSFDDILPNEIVPELIEQFNIVKNMQTALGGKTLLPIQLEAMKSLYDSYNSHLKYDLTKKRILGSAEKIRLGLQSNLEELGDSVGIDIKQLNKNISGGKALEKALIQANDRLDNNNIFGLSDTQTALISSVLGGGPVQVGLTLGAKSVIENMGVRNKIASSLYTKSNNAKPQLTSYDPNSGNSNTARSNNTKQFGGSNTSMNSSKPDIQVKSLPYFKKSYDPITPDGVVKSKATPPLPISPGKKDIVERGRATHNPYKSILKTEAEYKAIAEKQKLEVKAQALKTDPTLEKVNKVTSDGEYYTKYGPVEVMIPGREGSGVYNRGTSGTIKTGGNIFNVDEVEVYKKKDPTNKSDFDNMLGEGSKKLSPDETYIKEIRMQEGQKRSFLKQIEADMVDTNKLSPTELVEYNKLLVDTIQKRGEGGARSLEKLYEKFGKDVYGKQLTKAEYKSILKTEAEYAEARANKTQEKTPVPVKAIETKPVPVVKSKVEVPVSIRTKGFIDQSIKNQEGAFVDFAGLTEKNYNYEMGIQYLDNIASKTKKGYYISEGPHYDIQFVNNGDYKTYREAETIYKKLHDEGYDHLTDEIEKQIKFGKNIDIKDTTVLPKQANLAKVQEKQAVVEKKQTVKPKLEPVPKVKYTKSTEGKRLEDGKPIKEDSNTYRMLERADERKMKAKKSLEKTQETGKIDAMKANK